MISIIRLIATATIATVFFTAYAHHQGEFQKGQDAFDAEDWETAYLVWHPLAEQGDVDAQNSLGYMYANQIVIATSASKGLSTDNLYGYMWLSIAASRGHQLGKENLTTLTWSGFMSTKQMDHGKKLAAECEAKNYKDCGISQ